MQAEIFKVFAERYKNKVEKQMSQSIEQLKAPTIIKEAMDYSLQAGGKRIRPILLFATIAAFEKDPVIGLYPATAIEMIHTYSLIHDDLPSMDDDDLRRGKPTNHIKFGDAIAILAGDALLTYSFETITNIPNELASAETKLAIIRLLSQAAGAEGMVSGQVEDIQAEGKTVTIEQLEHVHVHKTGKLLESSVLAGAILAEASTRQIDMLKKFAYHIGIAFQIRDDILDVEGSEQALGKPLGSDEEKDKQTYPSLLTMAGAKDTLSSHINEAYVSLDQTGLQTDYLKQITAWIALRDH